MAANSHLEKLGRFPTGGLNYFSVGDPDLGTGTAQQGGWVFNILPYMEQEALYNLGAGGDATQKDGRRPAAFDDAAFLDELSLAPPARCSTPII